MIIKEVEKTIGREGFDNFHFIIINKNENEYPCVIKVLDKEVVDLSCSCKHGTFETARKVKTGKICRHLTFAKEYLIKYGEIK